MLPSLVIPYPAIDPVLIEIGPFAIRWYALAYIAGLILGWRYCVRVIRNEVLWTRAGRKAPIDPDTLETLLFWITIGVVVGGRLGFVLFYGLVYIPEYYLSNPLRIIAIWEGGMAFHGGLLGVVLAIWYVSRKHALDMVRVGDLVTIAVPIGIFFGRIANFINGELWGKAADVPWAMIFPDPEAGGVPRHPSQLYEAFLEGVVIFVILRLLTHRFDAFRRRGLVIGAFLLAYAVARAVSEVFRDSAAYIFSPDSGITMGMVLSLPMIAAGLFFLYLARRSA